MKLSKKHKRKIRREVDIERGISAPRRIIFKSKKVYDRKKYKNSDNNSGNTGDK
tara:strand:- start:245 stop:406 length:162 start_codon:yes stop_codon:yes gene_type:complete